jgi:putative acetyltransferase
LSVFSHLLSFARITSVRFIGCDLSRASELMRSTPSVCAVWRDLIVQVSSMRPSHHVKVLSMSHSFCLELIDTARHPRLSALRELLHDYQRYIGVDLCFQSFEEEMALLPGQFAPPEGRLYAALIGEQLAGCIALRRHDDQCAEMKRLFVRPAFHGQGLGKQLAMHIIQDAQQLGYRRIMLDTLPMMQAAQTMYEAMGFKDTSAYVHNPIAGVRYMALELMTT